MRSEQCRAARALLGWTQRELAAKARVGLITVRHFETAAHVPRLATLDAIKRAFESAGIEFIDENGGGAGVRWRDRSQPKK
jgi:transcriptional regulator with XRE-family HTH domain